MLYLFADGSGIGQEKTASASDQIGEEQAYHRYVCYEHHDRDKQKNEGPHFFEQLPEFKFSNCDRDIQGHADGRCDSAENEGQYHDHSEVDSVDPCSTRNREAADVVSMNIPMTVIARIMRSIRTLGLEDTPVISLET